MIEVSCPNCRTFLSMPDATAGQQTSCMTCGKSVQVPWPLGREPAVAEEERPARRSRRNDEDDYDDRRRVAEDYDDRPQHGFRCPHCRTTARPLVRNELSETGLVLLIVLLFVFFPLFWIGLLMRENVKYCVDCGAKLGKCL